MEKFLSRWQFVRSETLDLLNALHDQNLSFTPGGEKWQPLYYQFGCIGRTQLIYAEAARTGKMNFELFGSHQFTDKNENKTVDAVKTFLAAADKVWYEALSHNEGSVQWPDGLRPLLLHMECLAEHERLHHGQLISYFTLANFELPENFKNNWAL